MKLTSSSFLLILSLFELTCAVTRFQKFKNGASRFGSSVGNKFRSAKRSVGNKLYKGKKAIGKGFNKMNPFKVGLKGDELSSATRDQMDQAKESQAYCINEQTCNLAWTSGRNRQFGSKNWMGGLEKRSNLLVPSLIPSLVPSLVPFNKKIDI